MIESLATDFNVQVVAIVVLSAIHCSGFLVACFRDHDSKVTMLASSTRKRYVSCVASVQTLLHCPIDFQDDDQVMVLTQ